MPSRRLSPAASRRAIVAALLAVALSCTACAGKDGARRAAAQVVLPLPASAPPSRPEQADPPAINQETGCELYGGACGPQPQ